MDCSTEWKRRVCEIKLKSFAETGEGLEYKVRFNLMGNHYIVLTPGVVLSNGPLGRCTRLIYMSCIRSQNLEWGDPLGSFIGVPA